MTTSHSMPDDGLIQEDRPAQEDLPAQEDGPAAETPGLIAEPLDTAAEAPVTDTSGIMAEPQETPPGDAFAADIPPTNPDYRWREIQAMFVDDPRGSVERAADLARDALRELTSLLREREQSLRSRWQDNNTDTEELRISLRSYRALVDRVAEFSRPS